MRGHPLPRTVGAFQLPALDRERDMTGPHLLRFKGHPVPYIAAWSSETVPLPQVYAAPDGLGLVGHARDTDGVLWKPFGLRLGMGRPEYGTVHGPRQRRCMRRLLCQVCGQPADRDEQGVLWLLEDDRDEDWWPEDQVTTHPPVCRPCAGLAARMCPHLQGKVVAVRVGRPIVDAVWGQLYFPERSMPIPGKRDVVRMSDPAVRWMLGGQLAASLLDARVVDLPELRAGVPA
ncbi:hypothetical protein GCM10014715_39540 [Streptomyces spiralis]|uniref:Uncharacterized protein n=1 Tax=Streptomyces spiralis TaxID=66376 RepID=A0A919DTY9_9ACTN|nr:hypothetical protein [Streptomyces spiralis]GHE80241.1 hypothetical protein GCM10014715_39540 [Streptomyces spiralis]